MRRCSFACIFFIFIKDKCAGDIDETVSFRVYFFIFIEQKCAGDIDETVSFRVDQLLGALRRAVDVRDHSAGLKVCTCVFARACVCVCVCVCVVKSSVFVNMCRYNVCTWLFGGS
jgi:hypothetical protein